MMFSRTNEIKIFLNEKKYGGIKKPEKAHEYDACYDIFATEKLKNNQYLEYKTGVHIEMPKNFVGLLFPRSSITKYDMMLKNSVGVIDSTYRGELCFRFIKTYNDLYQPIRLTSIDGYYNTVEVIPPMRNIDEYKVGDKIGQIMFLELPKTKLVFVNQLNNSERSDKGFGSTGN